LIGVFIASVISAILPIQLFNPEWQDKLIGSICGGASFPVEVVSCVILAKVLSPNDPNLIKQICLFYAIAFGAVARKFLR